MPGNPAWSPSWDLVRDIQIMWSLPSMVNAYRAGTIIAVTAGVVGWFMVLRRQSFAGHTISVAGFPGAAAAVLLGVASGYGYFGFCVAAALVIAYGTRPGARDAAHESALTGVVQAFALACGMLFVSLYGGFLNQVDTLLFGTILGITSGDVLVLAAVAVAVLAVLAVIGRALLFASVDPGVARARGVPVRLLGAVFLVLLGAATAEVSQITGSLLVFALLVMPAATAQLITARPATSLLLTVLIGFAVTWAGFGFAFFTAYPIGFYITTFAFGTYVLAYLVRLAGPTVAARFPRPSGESQGTAKIVGAS
ncbi:metal ABC transporter permease [Actinocrinis puniceicyclus]|uniref:Metal ABC transporter permease n=1 Tax=Actinocrinis puniceicyclus TaxID=977794 RepID=A0A8J7WIL1_9ACTN|nr:metal ABC transporter permease [Actinocrinis puniceicyclus]MBS2962876.1 metal ABC transporter permease [Actinocrinis puniceicyclus]